MIFGDHRTCCAIWILLCYMDNAVNCFYERPCEVVTDLPRNWSERTSLAWLAKVTSVMRDSSN